LCFDNAAEIIPEPGKHPDDLIDLMCPGKGVERFSVIGELHQAIFLPGSGNRPGKDLEVFNRQYFGYFFELGLDNRL